MNKFKKKYNLKNDWETLKAQGIAPKLELWTKYILHD